MTQQYTSIIVILLCLAALWLLSPSFRRLAFRTVIGKPNLRFEDLPQIFDGTHSFRIEKNPRKKLSGVDRSIQAYDDKVSVIYHTTKHDKGLSETVDIAYRGKFGMIMTLVNGKVTVLERIGGTTRRNPELSTEEERALSRFMVALRECFDSA